jgi:hypothetical protein
MDFKTTKAEVTLQNINYALGLRSDVNVFTKVDDLKIKWTVDITERSWGIKAMDVSITEIFMQIEWKVYKEDLTLTEITSLLCKNDMFHSVFIDAADYVIGEFRIFGNMFNIIENLEVNGGILEIEEVLIDFMDNEIHIL